MGKDQIYFQLREKGKRRKRKPEEKERSWDYDYEYTPLGKLQLKLFGNKWGHPSRIISDTKSQNLEERLAEFFFNGYFGRHCATHFGHVVPPVSEVIVPV